MTSEVLPTIRKTGGYVADDELFINTYLSSADEKTRMFVKTSLTAMRELNRKIEADKPKVAFAEALSASETAITVNELAKLLKQNGYETGEKRLYQWLREHGYLMNGNSEKNLPTQRAMDMGLFEVQEHAVETGSTTIIRHTTRVTPKGVQYFLNKLAGIRKGV